MIDLYGIQRNDKPAWYELSLDLERMFLCLSIEDHILDYLIKMIRHDSPLVKSWENILNYKGEETFFGRLFVLPSQDDWGMGGVIRRCESKIEGWASFRIPIPPVRDISDEERQFLSSIYEREGANIDNGTLTYEFYKNYFPMNCMRVSLQILFQLLPLDSCSDFDFSKVRNNLFQLMAINYIAVEFDFHGGSLSISVSKRLAQWLKNSFTSEKADYVIEAMKKVYNHMWPDLFNLDKFGFRLNWAEGKISLSVPGDACGLDPDDGHYVSNDGYSLCPHNVDSGLQQVSLLCGIVALVDLARKDGV